MINNDQPKNSIKEDELGYSYLSYYFAKIIKEVETKDKAYVLGLCGNWGAGKTTVINYIKEKGSAKTAEISDLLKLSPSRTRDYLKELVNEGCLIALGANKNRKYKLKK